MQSVSKASPIGEAILNEGFYGDILEIGRAVICPIPIFIPPQGMGRVIFKQIVRVDTALLKLLSESFCRRCFP